VRIFNAQLNELEIMEKEKVKGLLLEDLWELCYRAHTWTSFSPEKRATRYIVDYSEILENDLKELGENQGNYKEKFIKHFSDWMASKGRCASTMITGGANFDVRRNQKALNAERNKNEAFTKWREKYFKAVNRESTLSPEEELDNALVELDEAKARQELMKEANSILRKHKELTAFEHSKMLLEMGFETDLIREASQVNGELIFARFSLTNNNAKIKRLEEKVLTMKKRIETKNDFEDVKFEGGYWTISDDRVKIFHDEKPSKEVIQNLKSNGFRWSPFWKCWCRKHTENAIRVVKSLTN
jgi:hypothetical protein